MVSIFICGCALRRALILEITSTVFTFPILFQLSIFYEVQVQKPGRYILVIKYLQPDRSIRRVNVRNGQSQGLFEALPCTYKFACLHAVIDDVGQPMAFELKGNNFRNKISLSTTSPAKIGIVSKTRLGICVTESTPSTRVWSLVVRLL